MRRSQPFTIAIVGVFVAACGGGQAREQGPAERAGKKLDEAAGSVKETGDKVGKKVGKTLERAGEGVKHTFGADEPSDGGVAPAASDAG